MKDAFFTYFMLLYRLIMKKICEILLLSAILYISLEANSEIGQYQVGKTESGRYLAHLNSGKPYVCHFHGPANTQVSDICYDKNKGNETGGKYAYVFPRIGSSYPACPPLPNITNGYWKCPQSVYPNAVEVYASCATRCFRGFKLQEAKVIRCPESLKWEKFPDLHCFPENESCSLRNLNFITSTPLQVIISWNTTAACHNAVYTLLMKGPNQNLTKQLQKNSNFIVIKNIYPDMEYEVSIYLKEEQLISGTFTSAAMGSPQKPVDVYVHALNATAVNITWTANSNDSFTSVTDYMVNITCDDHWFTLNTSENVLILSMLETGKEYKFTVKAYNQYCIGLDSEPVYFKMPEMEEDLPVPTDNDYWYMWPIGACVIGISVLISFFVCWKRKRHKSRRNGSEGDSRNSQEMQHGDALVENPTCTTTLLKQPDGSEFSSSKASHPSTSNAEFNLENLDYEVRSRNRRSRNVGPRETLGSDSGRGSESGTDSTVSDTDKLIDAEKCTCTFSAFQDSHSLEHIERLADLLDPHDYYTDLKSWKGLAKCVLHWDSTKIIAVGFRTKNAFKEVVLEHLSSEGKKLGHLMYYFSRSDTYREDVIELVKKIHLECSFCDKIIASEYPS